MIQAPSRLDMKTLSGVLTENNLDKGKHLILYDKQKIQEFIMPGCAQEKNELHANTGLQAQDGGLSIREKSKKKKKKK